MQSTNIVFTGQNQVEVRREEVPPLLAGQILVESRQSLISTGTEGIVLSRNFAPETHWEKWVRYPFYPGYNNAGRVLEVAHDVTNWKVGDRIAARAAHKQLGIYNVGATASAEVPDGMRVESARISRIPDAISDEQASWFGMACIAQIGVHSAKHEVGDAVVIIGLGLLGQLVTQYVRAMGAREVIVVETSQMRLDMALSHGATQAINAPVGEARERVLDLTDGKGADVVYDVTGHPDVFASALGLARRFGKLVLLGDAGSPSEQRLTSDVITRGVRIIGVHDGHIVATESETNRWTHKNMTDLFFAFLARGQMRVDDLITHRYSPLQAPQAYESLQADRANAMGVVFDWTQLQN